MVRRGARDSRPRCLSRVRRGSRAGSRFRGTSKMFKIAVSGFAMAMCLGFAHAQDIAGIEDCTKAAGLDKRTGCLQSNINFLQRLLTKNALEAGQQLSAARNEIIALKSALAGLQSSVQQLQAAQKPAGEKKPESK